jgi:hypothetical protein
MEREINKGDACPTTAKIGLCQLEGWSDYSDLAPWPDRLAQEWHFPVPGSY